jgi:hypothetical protein
MERRRRELCRKGVPHNTFPKTCRRFEEVTQLTDAFCRIHLNEEYAQLCREGTDGDLVSETPFAVGARQGHHLGLWNYSCPGHGQLSLRFLTNAPSCGQPDLGIFRTEFFDHAGQIEADSRSVGMYPMDPDWSTPSMLDQNPLVWMLEVNGLIIDVRHAPREIQAAAFRQGLIPYIPEV